MARSLRSILLRRAGSRSNIVVLDAIGANKAFFVGNSMGGFATLHIGMRHPDRVLGLVAAGCGYGAHPDQEATFRAEARKLAHSFRDDGSEEVASWYGFAPARLRMLAKDPQGHAEHIKVLGEHDRIGASNTRCGGCRPNGRPCLIVDRSEACEERATPSAVETAEAPSARTTVRNGFWPVRV